MNTIEQAREVSARLAERARRLSRTLRMRPRIGLDEESADTIDALLVENAALLAANRDCVNHFDAIKEDYDKAVAELAKWEDANTKAGWINELRDHAKLYLAQRKVLVQALEALNTCHEHRFAGTYYKSYCEVDVEEAVTVIKEILK